MNTEGSTQRKETGEAGSMESIFWDKVGETFFLIGLGNPPDVNVKRISEKAERLEEKIFSLMPGGEAENWEIMSEFIYELEKQAFTEGFKNAVNLLQGDNITQK